METEATVRIYVAWALILLTGYLLLRPCFTWPVFRPVRTAIAWGSWVLELIVWPPLWIYYFIKLMVE